jgi:hypothetical protein
VEISLKVYKLGSIHGIGPFGRFYSGKEVPKLRWDSNRGAAVNNLGLNVVTKVAA